MSLPGREIRVFISSTFRDMKAERDILVAKTLPELRRMCEQRNVAWREVDLRWGISDEQAAEGRVLPICLEEIRRCRPCFIGLLGERYGWVPESYPPQVVEQEPWLADYADDQRSVTELEILHGVLNNPDVSPHSFFYFRDPAYVETIPESQRDDFVSRDEAGAEKLANLKQRIREAHRSGDLRHAPRENFRNAEALSQMVLADFRALIDGLFPAGEEPSPVEQERAEHVAFARSRSQVYIGREAKMQRLSEHVAGEGPPLVVLGESGGGKSALLANWALEYARNNEEDFVFLHFVGGSTNGASDAAILRRIMLELAEFFQLSDEPPIEADEIRRVFPDWLARAAHARRVILVLDGLNQLSDADGAPDLNWLPRVTPRNCRIIVSTLPGRCLNAIEKREWMKTTPPIVVEPLTGDERRKLIREFLAQYSRDLGEQRTARLVQAPQTANPLYLRVLLDELRVFGVHEQLNERIEWCLQAEDAFALYQKVIDRWRESYGEELVDDSLSYIWASRRGLSEAELLDLLGAGDQPLPGALWSPLYLAMADSLVSRNGLLNFAHDYLRAAVKQKCLPTDNSPQEYRRRMIAYFDNEDRNIAHALDELPWLLGQMGDWQSLLGVLTHQNIFLYLFRLDLPSLLIYWRQLEDRYDVGACYLEAWEDWRRADFLDYSAAFATEKLADFLKIIGRYEAAETMCRRHLEIVESADERDDEAIVLSKNSLAVLFNFMGRRSEAESYIRSAIELAEQIYRGEEEVELAAMFSNLGELMRVEQRFEDAEEAYSRWVEIYERHKHRHWPPFCVQLNNYALFLKETSRPQQAAATMKLAMEQFEAHYGIGSPDYAMLLNNYAALLHEVNQVSKVESLYQQSVQQMERLLGSEHPRLSLSLQSLANFYRLTGRFEEARNLYLRAIAIDESVLGPDHVGVALAVNSLGLLELNLENWVEAETIFRKAIDLQERAGAANSGSYAMFLGNLFVALSNLNRAEEAEPLLRRALELNEAIYGAASTHAARDRHNLASLLEETGRLEEAIQLSEEAIRIEEQAGGQNLAVMLGNLAAMLMKTERRRESEALMERSIKLVLDFSQATGRRHADLTTMLESHRMLLKLLGRAPDQIENRLADLLSEYPDFLH